MADRLLVFANEEVQKLLKEEFVAVAADDWYQRRRKDEVGKFFRKVASQGPRDPNQTQQGHYVFTAKGTLLGFNNNRGPEKRLAMMKEALKKWEALPEVEKTVEVPEKGKSDERYHHELPEGGQIVKVFTRCLEAREGRLQKLAADKVGNQAAVDHLWFQQAEVEKLGKLIAEGGGEVPEWLGLRIARFHLRDNTRGEPRDWKNAEIKKWSLKVDGKGKMSGDFLIDSADGKLGYEGEFQGRLAVERGRLVKFDLLVIGKHWGHGEFTWGARPGKTPMGQVFQLSGGKEVRDRIPPQGIRWAEGYWKPGRFEFKKGEKGAELEQKGDGIHPLDLELVVAIKEVRDKKRTIWEVRKTLGKERMFDGISWYQASKYFRIHAKDKALNRSLNKQGTYLIWKLPSSEKLMGRTQLAGLLWKEPKVSELFFGEVENFNTER